jgi:hypothetical protein
MKPEPESGDWSTSYSQYLARTAAAAARTLNLYQLALERVSQGQLPPTVFQDYFPSFATAHGAKFARRFAEVGSRFLSDLVSLGSGLSQNAVDAGETPESDNKIPEFDAANPARWYEQMAEYAGNLNARAIKAYRKELDRVAAGQATPSEVQQQTADQMANRLPSYLQKITRVYFELLNGLTDVRSAYEETYFQGLLASAKPGNGDAPVMLTLAAAIGGTAAAILSVTNTTGQPAQIAHQIGDARRVDGAGPSLMPAIAFLPEDLQLGPQEEATLTISLWLDPELYDRDVPYNGVLYLTGASEVPLEVKLRILATAAAPKPHRQ